MQNNKVNAQIIKENGWRQGSCLLVTGDREIYNISAEKKLQNGPYYVLSQDCDILNSCLQKEPVVELIQSVVVDSCCAEFMSGKNPRRLHLEINNKSNEFRPNDRYFISREYLQEFSSQDYAIVSRDLKILINWISKRYKRSALPDQFNKKIKGVIKNIKNVLSNEAKNSLGLYVRLDSEEELKDNEAYKVYLILLVRKKFYDDKNQLETIEAGFDSITSWLDNVPGIEILDSSRVVSDDDITLSRYQELKQWDFDYISYLNDESGETANDILL